MLTFIPLAPPPPAAPAPHTPGPWEAVPGTDWPQDELEIVAAGDPGKTIAVIIGENREANARLDPVDPREAGRLRCLTHCVQGTREN